MSLVYIFIVGFVLFGVNGLVLMKSKNKVSGNISCVGMLCSLVLMFLGIFAMVSFCTFRLVSDDFENLKNSALKCNDLSNEGIGRYDLVHLSKKDGVSFLDYIHAYNDISEIYDVEVLESRTETVSLDRWEVNLYKKVLVSNLADGYYVYSDEKGLYLSVSKDDYATINDKMSGLMEFEYCTDVLRDNGTFSGDIHKAKLLD